MAKLGFGKKLGDIASNASQKTGAIFESARLHSEINRILGEIENLQFELGCAYYEDNKGRSTGPYIEQIEKIKNLEYEMRIRDKKLLEQKGLQYCGGCDSIVSYEDEFCSKCGTPVPRDQKHEPQEECRNCGEPVSKQLQYCPKCGVLLS